MASYFHRYAMTALATQGEKRFVPSLLEAPGEFVLHDKKNARANVATTPSYSIDTVRKLKATLRFLRKMTLDPAKVATEARMLFDSMPKAYGADVRLSPRMNLIVQSAQAEATRLQDEYVSTEHLFLALAGEAGRSPAAQLLKRLGVTKDTLYQSLTQVRGNQA